MSAGGRLATLQRPPSPGFADKPAGFAWRGGVLPLPFPSVGPPAVGRCVSSSAPGRHAPRNRGAALARGHNFLAGGPVLEGCLAWWLSGSIEAPPSSRRRRGGIPRRRRSTLVQSPPSHSICGAACDRGCAAERGAGGEPYERAAILLARGDLRRGGGSLGARTSRPRQAPSGGIPCAVANGGAVRCSQNDFGTRVAHGKPPCDALEMQTPGGTAVNM